MFSEYCLQISLMNNHMDIVNTFSYSVPTSSQDDRVQSRPLISGLTKKRFQAIWNAARVEHVCYKCLNHLQLGKSAWNNTSIYLMLDGFQYNLRIWSKQ